ncbi:pentatricopeptide repeat-containing protein At5g04780, mitochondrial [Rhodamnia argentea]|uniref:Pentatricopeptide repeat-containing protein At5g04780, mitochondrial n=1 Tax=Rhodamnia argentea TaxID=178133 RepID=A0A8B8QVN4_9MYRT|nr:pentatricopeptide repeat-containing protein At5g04780, mitochondrial [Rhodamnia argentea]XP_030551121.1 pentatricopeptide repeat-containing protein At5g04780, mitochondrial [Rhodamnia argentea]XP_030551122.1 pentatricopeptide repeat-containing protein At5g04780, mitochondrial [Rhodamnia argentea]XP_048139756.1 pentatricopeptide repeat-containing protein At5g04780, mitochondrial [Rhodamnia argentea]XP_048139757.1 pentatricopeptide repeat-containing protein At5g04780, mitochondrial [Rhodamnia 
MNTLIRRRRNCRCFLYFRHLSAIADAKSDAPSIEIPGPGVPNVDKVAILHDNLRSCARTGSIMEAGACHAQVIRLGLESDVLVSNMVINTYSKCGVTSLARKMFEEMPHRNLVSWNTMISSHSRDGEEQEALVLFMWMQREGTQFGEFTVSSVLCACAATCAVLECKQLHAFAMKSATDSNVFVATALLDVYAKCGLIGDASLVFEFMQERSDVTWSSMMAGFVQNDMNEEALSLFHRAQAVGLKYDHFIVSSAISACAGLVALIQGKQFHAIICKSGFGSNIFVCTSLIDMYAKCGTIREAYLVFSGVEEKSVALMNAMISGFAKHARSLEAMILYEKMRQMGIYPNEATYVSMLSACSHVGLVENGRKYFDLMTRDRNVFPNVLHYSCMVDILGRAGLVDEAYDLIIGMPFDATPSIWGSLLASCRISGNLGIAEVAAKKLFELEPHNAGNHILLSNTYAVNKMWDGVSTARKLLKDSEVKKEKGKSWIELKDQVHSFVVGDRLHPKIADVYLKLDDLFKEVERRGYRAETEHDLHDLEVIKKQELLRHHSEKLALAFGLLCLPPSAPIRIMKNLRICGDCHSFMKIASGVTNREIIVRDTNRFHHFSDGYCSCEDFW